jgi:predicted membrane-bound spermidine synthase
MGGLALGNALAGKYASRVGRPLVTYARLETLVAIAGLAVTFLLPHFAVVLRPLTLLASDSVPAVNAIRLVAAFLVLIVPATAMGATFPVVVGALSAGADRFGVSLGRLYGWNTLGAVVGVVTAELILVDRFGVAGAAGTAAVLNLLAAGLAMLSVGRPEGRPLPSLARSSVSSMKSSVAGRPSGRPEGSKGISADSAVSAFPLRVLLASAFLSGMALLALEVTWFRFLTMYVLSTTLAASLMLAIVLAGIAIGGLIGSVWSNRAPERAAAVVSLVAACAVIVTYGSFQSLTSGTQVGYWQKILWFACVLTAPTSLLSGLLFTLVGRAIRRGVDEDTRAAAWLTVANTTGALCGAPLAGFVLLPLAGMERTFFMLAVLYAVIGLIIVASLGLARSLRRWPIAISTAAAALALLLFPFGAMKDRYFPRAAAAYADDGSEIVATREGRSETIFLMQQKWLGQPVYNRLVTNGFSMTGTAVPGKRYMRYFAYWPMLMHNGPIRHALLVCYGVGVTAGAVLDIPSLESLDVAEISRDIVAMSDVIYAGERQPLHAPGGRSICARFVGSEIRSDYGRAAASPHTWRGEHLHPRIFSARLRQAGGRRHHDVLASCRTPRPGNRCRHDPAGLLRCVRRLLAVERDAIRSDDGRNETRDGAGVRRADARAVANTVAAGAFERSGLRATRTDRRDVRGRCNVRQRPGRGRSATDR